MGPSLITIATGQLGLVQLAVVLTASQLLQVFSLLSFLYSILLTI